MFSVRLVSADSYQAPPLPQLDPTYSDFRGAGIKHIPVIRVFGSTSSGEKTCLHIHGVFPYLYVPYTGGEDGDSLSYRLAASLDAAINVSLGSASSTNQHVYKVQRISGIPFYGYHRKEHQYFKIYFYNPAMIKRSAGLLQNGAVLNQSLQPHEAHIPYILQFMIDYNLYGMSFINFKSVKHRLPTKSSSDIDMNSGSSFSPLGTEDYLPSSVVRQSTCELEVDGLATDILNRRTIEGEMALNPGLALIWDEERARRAQAGFHGGDSQLVNPKSPTRPPFESTENDIYQQQRLAQRLLLISQCDESSLTVSQPDSSSYPIEVEDDNNLLEASYLDQHVGPSTRNPVQRQNLNQSHYLTVSQDIASSLLSSPMQRLSQSLDCSVLDADDIPLVDLLTELARENSNGASMDEDSVLGSQHNKPASECKSDSEDDADDLNLTSLQLDTLSGSDFVESCLRQPGTSEVKYKIDEMLCDPGNMSVFNVDTDNSSDTSICESMPQFDGAGDVSPNMLKSEKKEPKYATSNSLVFRGTTFEPPSSSDLEVSQSPTQYQTASSSSSTQYDVTFDLELPESLTADLYLNHCGGIFNEQFEHLPEVEPEFGSDLENLQSTIEIGMLSPSTEETSEVSNQNAADDKIPLEMVLNGDPCFTESAVFDKSDLTELQDQYVSLLGSALLPGVYTGAGMNPSNSDAVKTVGLVPNIEDKMKKCSIAKLVQPSVVSGGASPSENITPNIQLPDNSDYNSNFVATWEQLQRKYVRKNGAEVLSGRNTEDAKGGKKRSRSKRDSEAVPNHVNASENHYFVAKHDYGTTIRIILNREKQPENDSIRNEPNRKVYARHKLNGAKLPKVSKNQSYSFYKFHKSKNDVSNKSNTSEIEKTVTDEYTLPTGAALRRFESEDFVTINHCKPEDVRRTLPGVQYSSHPVCENQTVVESVLADFEDSEEDELLASMDKEILEPVASKSESRFSYYSSSRSHDATAYRGLNHRHGEYRTRKKIFSENVYTPDQIWVIEKRKRRRQKAISSPHSCTKKDCPLPVLFVEKLALAKVCNGINLKDFPEMLEVHRKESCRAASLSTVNTNGRSNKIPSGETNEDSRKQEEQKLAAEIASSGSSTNTTDVSTNEDCNTSWNTTMTVVDKTPNAVSSSQTATITKGIKILKQTKSKRAIIRRVVPEVKNGVPKTGKKRVVILKLTNNATPGNQNDCSNTDRILPEDLGTKSDNQQEDMSIEKTACYQNGTTDKVCETKKIAEGPGCSQELQNAACYAENPSAEAIESTPVENPITGLTNGEMVHEGSAASLSELQHQQRSNNIPVSGMSESAGDAQSNYPEKKKYPRRRSIRGKKSFKVSNRKTDNAVNACGPAARSFVSQTLSTYLKKKYLDANESNVTSEDVTNTELESFGRRSGQTELLSAERNEHTNVSSFQPLVCQSLPCSPVTRPPPMAQRVMESDSIDSLSSISSLERAERAKVPLTTEKHDEYVIQVADTRSRLKILLKRRRDNTIANSSGASSPLESSSDRERGKSLTRFEAPVKKRKSRKKRGRDSSNSTDVESNSSDTTLVTIKDLQSRSQEKLSNILNGSQIPLKTISDIASDIDQTPVPGNNSVEAAANFPMQKYNIVISGPDAPLDEGGLNGSDFENCTEKIDGFESEEIMANVLASESQLDKEPILNEIETLLEPDDLVNSDSALAFSPGREYAIDAITPQIPKCLFEEDSNSEEDKLSMNRNKAMENNNDSLDAVADRNGESFDYLPDHKSLDVYDIDDICTNSSVSNELPDTMDSENDALDTYKTKLFDVEIVPESNDSDKPMGQDVGSEVMMNCEQLQIVHRIPENNADNETQDIVKVDSNATEEEIRSIETSNGSSKTLLESVRQEDTGQNKEEQDKNSGNDAAEPEESNPVSLDSNTEDGKQRQISVPSIAEATGMSEDSQTDTLEDVDNFESSATAKRITTNSSLINETESEHSENVNHTSCNPEHTMEMETTVVSSDESVRSPLRKTVIDMETIVISSSPCSSDTESASEEMDEENVMLHYLRSQNVSTVKNKAMSQKVSINLDKIDLKKLSLHLQKIKYAEQEEKLPSLRSSPSGSVTSELSLLKKEPSQSMKRVRFDDDIVWIPITDEDSSTSQDEEDEMIETEAMETLKNDEHTEETNDPLIQKAKHEISANLMSNNWRIKSQGLHKHKKQSQYNITGGNSSGRSKYNESLLKSNDFLSTLSERLAIRERMKKTLQCTPVQEALEKRKEKKQTIVSDPKLLMVNMRYNEIRWKKTTKKQKFLLYLGMCPVDSNKMEWPAKPPVTAFIQLQEPRVVLERLSPSITRKYQPLETKSNAKVMTRQRRNQSNALRIPSFDGAADASSDESDPEPDLTIERHEQRTCMYKPSAKAAQDKLADVTPCVTPKKRKHEANEPGLESPNKRRRSPGSSPKSPYRSPRRTSMLQSPGCPSRSYSPLNVIVTSPKVLRAKSPSPDPQGEPPEVIPGPSSVCTTPRRRKRELREQLLREKLCSLSPRTKRGCGNSEDEAERPEQFGELINIPGIGLVNPAMDNFADPIAAPNTQRRSCDVEAAIAKRSSSDVRKKLVFPFCNEKSIDQLSAIYENVITDKEDKSVEVASDEKGIEEPLTEISGARDVLRVCPEASDNKISDRLESINVDENYFGDHIDTIGGRENQSYTHKIKNNVDQYNRRGKAKDHEDCEDDDPTMKIPNVKVNFLADEGQSNQPEDAISDEDEEDLCNVTFTQYIDTQLDKSSQCISSHRSRSPGGTRREVVIMPRFNPPGYQSVVESMEAHGIPTCRNEGPFFSNHDDVMNQKEVAQKMLKIPSKSALDLQQFKSDLDDVTGIRLWRRMKVNEFHPSGAKLKSCNMRRNLAGHCDMLITPLFAPPAPKTVRTWLRAKEYLKKQKEQEEVKKAEPLGNEKTETPASPTPRTPDSDIVEASPEARVCTVRSEKSLPATPRTSKPDGSRKRTIREKIKQKLLSRSRCSLQPLASVPENSSDNSQISTNSVDDSLRIALENTKLYKDPESSRRLGVSCGQIELATQAGQFKLPCENLKDAKALTTHQYLTLLCMEAHVATRGDLLPDPQRDSIRAIFYAIHNDVPSTSDRKPLEHGVIVVDPSFDGSKRRSGYLSDAGVTCPILYAPSEEALLDSIVTLIQRCDPDILVGWELECLSWGYVFQRATNLGFNLAPRISRIPSVQQAWETHTKDLDALAEIKLPGRIVLDIWRLMRHEIALQSYTFENVMYHIMHERLSCPSFAKLTSWWDHCAPRQRWMVADHYITRTLGTLKLLDHLDIIGRTSELARLFGIQFYEVFSRGSQFRVESMMLRLAKPSNYVPVSPSVQQRANMRAPEALPLIMEPESVFYSDPMIVLDFQSLYPSLIIAHNYCFSTCLGRIEHIGQPGPFEFGATTLKVTKGTALKLDGKVNFAPCGVAFVKPEVRKGVLPRMLSEILETRLMVKKAMKDHPQDDHTLQRALHSRQLGLKLIANVTYGYTSANFSGRMPCIDVGDSVVSKGRETLERAIKLVEATPRWGARVIYGDTDSLFVLIPGKTRKQAFEVGAEIAAAVTAANPPPVKLKLEKILQPAILQTKKRYCGYMYESPDQEKPTYLAKGIETVRRDGCPAVSKILEKTLKILFDTKDVSQVKRFVTRQLDKVLRGRVSIQDLTFAREFRGMQGYKASACVPALELTRRLTQKDPRAVPRSGERVPYIIVAGAPNQALIQCVRSPWELISDPGLRPNALYYITRVIIPPLNRCLNLLGADCNVWFSEMPHRQAVNMPSKIGDKQKSTISQYFGTMACAVCSRTSNKGICADCLLFPNKTLVILHEKLRRIERTYHHINMVCQSCVGRADNKDCASLDCPNLYRLAQAKRDLHQASYLRQVIDNGESLEF